ncbi:MAG TPA: site-specific DNA-methyltransferase [Acidimicrobiales bacterium]|nr:site-specific DNA-methyltransferase [Acidimicrobiales bacterium]
MVNRSTSTSAFGVSRRESHDASGFYSRFTAPDLSSDSTVHSDRELDKLIRGDSRSMGEVADSSVALVVTSPPYFAGKQYEEALGEGGVPATYFEYLELLREVFAECVRKLEPGGRIAVNVANLGRRPYRSLSADVIGILQDDLRLLLRGEIIWVKQRGSSGSCAWGSFQRPGNPVLRDLTERVIVASKGRFDRAVPARDRHRKELPSEASMTREDFMENTLDVWEIPPESATRVGHPAPFPLELPSRLIELYTYRDDLVLDPFVGAGTTAVAALRTGRHYVGYDLDESYVQLAEERVAEERRRLLEEEGTASRARVSLPAAPATPGRADDLHSRSVREGWVAKEIARALIDSAGFVDVQEGQKRPGGVQIDFTARDRKGAPWFFDVPGSYTVHRAGLKRTDALWKALGKAAVLRETGDTPLVLLTTDVPTPGGKGARALAHLCGPGKPIYSVVEMLEPSAADAMRDFCKGGHRR